MIKLHFEILPFGSQENKYSMGWLHIINDGEPDRVAEIVRDEDEREYTYLLFDKKANIITFGSVRHKRSEGFWKLIKKVWEDIELP